MDSRIKCKKCRKGVLEPTFNGKFIDIRFSGACEIRNDTYLMLEVLGDEERENLR
jgi:hypothetical protein